MLRWYGIDRTPEQEAEARRIGEQLLSDFEAGVPREKSEAARIVEQSYANHPRLNYIYKNLPEMGGEEEWDYSDFMIDFDDLDFGWDHPIALYPVQRSARLQAQRGYFTIHGDIIEPLNEINPKVIQQVKFPKEIIPDAQRFLHMAGINDYSMFPDLDGLARDLHRKNGI